MENNFVNMDFRLNKAEMLAFIELLLNDANQKATFNEQANIEFFIKPGTKPHYKYGQHLNAQEVNNFRPYDKCSLKVYKNVNGSFSNSFWLVVNFKNFTFEIENDCPLVDALESKNLTSEYIKFMYYIFGENYKLALVDLYKTLKADNLASENKDYLRKLQKYSGKKTNSKEKFSTKKYHNVKRNNIVNYFDGLIADANDLDANFLNIQ